MCSKSSNTFTLGEDFNEKNINMVIIRFYVFIWLFPGYALMHIAFSSFTNHILIPFLLLMHLKYIIPIVLLQTMHVLIFYVLRLKIQ